MNQPTDSTPAPFVHLHVHSQYSFIENAGTVQAIVNEAHRLGMPAIALTDEGNLHGAIEFARTAARLGVKPIFGFEAWLAPGTRNERETRRDASPHRLILLARDMTGYRNLLKLTNCLIGMATGRIAPWCLPLE